MLRNKTVTLDRVGPDAVGDLLSDVQPHFDHGATEQACRLSDAALVLFDAMRPTASVDREEIGSVANRRL